MPVLARLSVDPSSSPLCLGIDSAIDAMLLQIARTESQAVRD